LIRLSKKENDLTRLERKAVLFEKAPSRKFRGL